jgi:hypothetical protein
VPLVEVVKCASTGSTAEFSWVDELTLQIHNFMIRSIKIGVQEVKNNNLIWLIAVDIFKELLVLIYVFE